METGPEEEGWQWLRAWLLYKALSWLILYSQYLNLLLILKPGLGILILYLVPPVTGLVVKLSVASCTTGRLRKSNTVIKSIAKKPGGIANPIKQNKISFV